MISVQLLEEIIFISEKEKYLDKKIIERIFHDIIDKVDSDTKKRFNGIYFCNTNWNGNIVCTCDPILGNIKIDYEKLISQYKHCKYLTVLMSNLDMITDFLHEIEHLKEESKMKLLNIESLLISYSSFEMFESLALDKLKLLKNILSNSRLEKMSEKAQEKIYLKIYDKIPSERLATINSHKILFESICKYEGFSKKYEETFNYINEIYVSKYYMGYNKIYKNNCFNIPIIDYLKFIKHPELLEIFDFYCEDSNIFLKKCSKEFNVEEKMLYGLPITLEETEEMDKKLILTNNK